MGSSGFQRVAYSNLVLVSEASFSSAGCHFEEIWLRLQNESVDVGFHAAKALHLQLSTHCEVLENELVVLEISGKYGHEEAMLTSFNFKEDGQQRKEGTISLRAEKPDIGWSAGYKSALSLRMAVRFAVRNPSTSASLFTAVLAVYPSDFFPPHWMLQRWDSSRSLAPTHSLWKSLPRLVDQATAEGMLEGTSDRVLVWIPDTNQCLRISRKIRLDHYMLQLRLIPWKGNSPPEGSRRIYAPRIRQ